MPNQKPPIEQANKSPSADGIERPSTKHVSRSAFNKLRESGELFDFKIQVEDREFLVHKFVLAIESDYFRAMLAHDSKESQEGKALLKNLTSATMESILDFCYTGEIELTHDNTQQILLAASMLQMQTIQDNCASFIRIHLDSANCLGVLILSERINLKSLADTSWNYCLNNFQEVSNEREFIDLNIDYLKKLLSDDRLNVDDESEVMDAIKKWIESDIFSRECHLLELMKLVRFVHMDTSYLARLNSYQPIRNSEECRDFLHLAKDYFILNNYPEEQAAVKKFLITNSRTCPKRQRLYAVGGWMDQFKSIATAEVYNPKNDTWTSIESMSQKRCGVGIVTYKDSIYAIGGHDGSTRLSSVERYDVYKERWFNDVADMKYDRTCVGVASLNGYIYAVGGQVSANGATDKVERYDPGTNSWQDCKPLLERRLGAGVVTCNGRIYVMGGCDGNKIFDSVEMYNPETDSWTFVAKMSNPRKHMGSCCYNDCIYVAGGRGLSSELEKAEVYHSKTDKWMSITNMSQARCGIGLVELAGLIYAVGGSEGDIRTNLVECYDPKTETWSNRASMKDPRLGGGMAVHPVIA